ncbi:MAG: hypothetical protein AAB397_00565 [Patescibacteria group bacterium]
MRKIIERKVFYQCSQCKKKYTNKTKAFRCERRTLEEKIFKIGDRVQNIEPRTCMTTKKQYIFSGRVTKIVGPNPSDYEYEMKWLANKKERLNAHVFMCQIKFPCPHCKEIREERYYAPELKLISRR